MLEIPESKPIRAFRLEANYTAARLNALDETRHLASDFEEAADKFALLEEEEGRLDIRRVETQAMVETAERFDAAILDVSERKVDVGGPGGPSKWEWTIKVQRRGAIELPIEVRVDDELLETWHSRGRETSKTFRVLRDKPLGVVRLGPAWIEHLDADLSNNARVLEADSVPVATLATRWTFYVEDLVRSHAGVAR